MIPANPLRKPKLHFEVTSDPSHVTFDDGKELRRNIPWQHYVEARWTYDEPEVVRVEIGDWLVVIRGHNMGPLFAALEEQTLLRVRAQPELGGAKERELDTFVLELRFTKPPTTGLGAKPGMQVELDLEN